MGRIVFLLEEPSMKELLDGLLPRLFPEIDFLCVPHCGCKDLEKSIPRKLRAWREPDVRFVILRDSDGGDCHAIKQKLVSLCYAAGRPDALVRIVCQELESWYWGEPAAMARAFGREELGALGENPRYRDADNIYKPSDKIKKRVPEFQKVSGARQMALHLSREGNSSCSFKVTMAGIEKVMAARGGETKCPGRV